MGKAGALIPSRRQASPCTLLLSEPFQLTEGTLAHMNVLPQLCSNASSDIATKPLTVNSTELTRTRRESSVPAYVISAGFMP